jgi:hypothetical protein
MRPATIAIALLLTGCAVADAPGDVALDGLALLRVAPTAVVPGTELAAVGQSFVPPAWGDTVLRLRDTAGSLDVALPARFVDYDHLVAAVDDAAIAALGGDSDLRVMATVEVVSAADGQTYTSPPLAVDLAVRRGLAPRVAAIDTGALIFVNDALEVTGDGFLLGGLEGTTVAVVRGCVAPVDLDGPCAPIDPALVPLVPDAAGRRDRAQLPFAPAIAGIRPGRFRGEVVVENRHAGGAALRASAVPLACELTLPAVFRMSPARVSLGQYVVVDGGGFVGGEPGASTELHLDGTFTGSDGETAPVALVLIPEALGGRTARYVVSEDDALGRAVDLRTRAGTFRGTATPVVAWAGQRVRGEPSAVELALAPPVQVVYLDFRPGYVEALRLFGLRAVDHEIRDRALDVIRAAYAGVAVDVRTEPPTDFALYTHVEVAGDDPNGMDLLGYDNSPGKDTGNRRLDDRLGGVNAETQEDGFPGYGGVFVTSLMGFSRHPAVGPSSPGADAAFDAVFDPVRPDRGSAVVAADLRRLPTPTGAGCPVAAGADRATAIACAVWAMGSLIGTTIAHEVGHSLGLANPYGEGFHDAGDEPDRLMDGGGARPFAERAELGGQGPGRFCDDEYAYLREILPSPEPASAVARPRCN